LIFIFLVISPRFEWIVIEALFDAVANHCSFGLRSMFVMTGQMRYSTIGAIVDQRHAGNRMAGNSEVDDRVSGVSTGARLALSNSALGMPRWGKALCRLRRRLEMKAQCARYVWCVAWLLPGLFSY